MAKTTTKKKGAVKPARTRRPRRRRTTPQDLYDVEMRRQTKLRLEMLEHQTKMERRRQTAAQVRMDAGMVSFEDVPYVFKPGDTIVDKYYGEPYAGEVLSADIRQGMFGRWWDLAVRVVSMNQNGKIASGIYTTKVSDWDGEIKISELPIRHMTADDKKMLVERGKIFRRVTAGAVHMNYDGEIIIPSWWSPIYMSAHGRVMIDGPGARLMEPDIMNKAFGYVMRSEDDDEDDESFAESSTPSRESVSDAQLHLTWPVVVGFSFKQKRWGILNVRQLGEIEFDKTIFDKLVLDAERKRVIKSLVEHSGESFADIVKGKSGGFIFLLHGAPGVGKTLTAEATAEVLSRPLYIVSVGELGTQPSELEDSLRKILELADRWNAVLLLDEADIFLEARTDHDLVRNAMVGVFLRLLEYYNGVMFLTTNRVKNFDKAFHSRISLAIQYAPKNIVEFRRKVWDNLLSSANIVGIDVKALENMELNGRQIKNCIRLAHTLAKAENRTVKTEDIVAMANFAHQFTTELAEAKNHA